MNKMIKKIKNMKIFKKKNKSYENDIQEDMVFPTGFGMKERIESMNSVDSIYGRGHRRDLDIVDVKNINVDRLKEKASIRIDSLKKLRPVDVKNMNVDGLKEKDSVDLDSVKTSMDSVDVKNICLLYTSPSPRDQRGSRMPSSA